MCTITPSALGDPETSVTAAVADGSEVDVIVGPTGGVSVPAVPPPQATSVRVTSELEMTSRFRRRIRIQYPRLEPGWERPGTAVVLSVGADLA
jgi:hypothetical protein